MPGRALRGSDGRRVAVACALACVLACAGCGGAPSRTPAGAGTSIAAAVIAFIAPRDGADVAIGAQLGSFAQTVQTKLLDDCMTSDGFPTPDLPTGGGTPSDLGNPQFPNLPVIEATHELGLFTGGPAYVGFADPQSGMSEPERQAWESRMNRCFGAMSRQAPIFGSARFARLNFGWFNIVNQVSRAAAIRRLSKKAATCSAAHGVPASSVMSLFARLQNQVMALSSPNGDSAKVQALQAKGADVLGACWTRVINRTTALLSARQATFLAQNANAITALQSEVNEQVKALGRQYGIKLALVGS